MSQMYDICTVIYLSGIHYAAISIEISLVSDVISPSHHRYLAAIYTAPSLAPFLYISFCLCDFCRSFRVPVCLCLSVTVSHCLSVPLCLCSTPVCLSSTDAPSTVE